MKSRQTKRRSKNGSKPITREQVLEELGKLAFSNMGEVVGADGFLRGDIPPEAMAAVEQWKITETEAATTCQVKLASKLKALELLGRHLDLYRGQGKQEERLPVILEGEDGLAD